MAKYQQNRQPVVLPVVQEPKAESAPIASMVVDPVKACKTCKFRVSGKCHRMPPVVISASRGMWPVVADGDWCGEHQFTVG
jgi:hypothetical protein